MQEVDFTQHPTTVITFVLLDYLFPEKEKENIKACKLLKKTTLWPLFMDGVQLTQGKSRFQEAAYFLPLSSQKFLVLILLTSEGWKAESTLEPTNGLNMGPLDWETSILTARPLLHKK